MPKRKPKPRRRDALGWFISDKDYRSRRQRDAEEPKYEEFELTATTKGWTPRRH